jgi:hypothetical protein
MRKLFLMGAVVAALSAPAAAWADPDDYATNPGLSQAGECGQYHGAFEFYSHTQGTPVFWIPTVAQEGGIGDTTGPANSAKGCQRNL